MKIPPGPSDVACLLVLHDVTELAETAAVKAQFVANASHELRTPLATIRTAVDSLAATEAGDIATLGKIAAILDRHVRRLEEMTNDLLDLHMVESAKVPLRLQSVGLDDLVRWVLAQFSDGAREKSILLGARAAAPQAQLRADRKLLELILRNLVDNAIKFTPIGGHVDCEFEATDGSVRLRVSDTGCGIAREDQPRVFERFYQTDAARTGAGKHRGTGLGLAIVKHAAERLAQKWSCPANWGGEPLSLF